MLHVICTRLRLGYLSVRVGDSSRCCEEIVKKISNSAFECDYYYIITVTDGRKKSEGLVCAVLASAVRMNDASRSIEKLPFSCFPSQNEDWRTAKPGPEHQIFSGQAVYQLFFDKQYINSCLTKQYIKSFLTKQYINSCLT